MKAKGTRKTNTGSQVSPGRQVAQLVSGLRLEALGPAIERRRPLTWEIPVSVAILKPAALLAAISQSSWEGQV